MISPRPPIAWVLATLTGLFAGRVAGQMIQRWAPQPFLPPFASFQGSELPYGMLLPLQLTILCAMIRSTWKVWRRTLPPDVRQGRWLAFAGGLYLFAALARLGIGLLVPEAAPWFRAWLPAIFHVVLATFVVALAHYHCASNQNGIRE